MTARRPLLLLPLSWLLAVGACSSEATGPADRPVTLVVAEGGTQFVLAGGTAALPLSVQARDPTSGRPLTDVEVAWTVVEGNGVTLSPATAVTDEVGIAGVSARVGSATGTYRVEARAPRLVGQPASFELRAVAAPVIGSISPSPAVSGQTVTVEGTGFSGSVTDHGILFGGMRGTVVSVTPTRITARVPACVLDRPVSVRITLGAVTSNAVQIETRAGAITPLSIEPGAATTLIDPDALACIAIQDAPAGARFLLVPQNAARTASIPLRYELNAIVQGGPPLTVQEVAYVPHRDVASDFELVLRRAERSLGPPLETAAAAGQPAGVTTVPEIGDRRDFNVLTADNGTRRITAAVRALSDRAVIYIDESAPTGGLSAADLAYFGTLFDDPIYATDTAVFGQPSDLDGNGRIIILFTPGVNALTEGGGSGFIAGYFYGCDLVSETRCSATNRGEIFYSMVPDPTGQFGGVRSRQVVLQTVPAVLAHEFQHMINFSRKGERLDVLWLSEGLAHAAEDLVGDVLAERGDAIRASDFRRPNYTRAQLYLRSTERTPLVAEDSPGTLEQRGAAWLLVKYITGHYGGAGLLGRLTAGSELGASNIEQSTGQSWPDIYAGFSVALWADGAPGLGGPIAATNEFADFDLRGAIGSLPGGFPLTPPVAAFQDLQLSNMLPAGSQTYLLFDVTSAKTSVRLGLTGPLGSPFGSATRPQLMIMRVR